MNSKKKTLHEFAEVECRLFDFVIYNPIIINNYKVFNRRKFKYSKFKSIRDDRFTIHSFCWNVPGFYSLPLQAYKRKRIKGISEVLEDCE